MVVSAFEASEAGRRPNGLCALAAEITPQFQGRGLATVEIDRGADVGTYWEPNVWIVHSIPPVGNS